MSLARADHDTIRFIAKAVDLTATGTTALTPVFARKFVVKSIKCHYKTVTTLTVVASASIGNNSTSFNNLMAITVVGVNTAGVDTIVDLTSSLLSVALDTTSTAVTLKVTTGATAAAATCDIHIEGYYAEP